ncbi:hypothetical protein [Longivirga aurantiaca]|uniref:Uncharacterized protein n=1 Tax=Longivirga aurantiaca TaxID=1837743 RepID=A0ABW1T0Y4_9ACTN
MTDVVVSTRTGLDSVEAALLDAVDLLGADDAGEPVVCARVLQVVAQRSGADPRDAYARLVRRGVPWSVHLPLVELLGNAGSRDAGPADPEQVDVRLSPVGALALASERQEVGPVPLGLVEGTLFRGGAHPPYDPASVVGALLAGRADLGPPALPTGCEISGDLAGLRAGREVTLTVDSTIRAEGGHLVITAIPYGVGPEQLHDTVRDARAALLAAHETCPMRRIEDESSIVDGVRLYVEPERGADLRDLRDWLLRIRPVHRRLVCRLPAPLPELMAGWEREDGSGLRALADLLRG